VSGPGSAEFYPTLGGFFVQVVLCWIAFALLPFSSEKGRSQLKCIEHENTGSARDPGGYIRYFLWYDLCVALLCSAAVVYVGFVLRAGEAFTDDWVIAQVLYTAQVCYGILAAPFFLFTIPGLQRILTHAMPSAYDRLGRCRAFQTGCEKKDQRRAKRKKEEEEQKTKLQLDLDEFTDRIKAALLNAKGE